MPRGQYDRSKMKKKGSSTDEAPKAEKKQRAPYGSKKAAATASAVQSAPRQVAAEALSILELAALRSSFTGQAQNTLIIGKIDSLVARQLDSIIGQVTSSESNGASKKVTQAPAPVVQQAAAPVPAAPPVFNPPLPSSQA